MFMKRFPHFIVKMYTVLAGVVYIFYSLLFLKQQYIKICIVILFLLVLICKNIYKVLHKTNYGNQEQGISYLGSVLGQERR